MAAEFYIGLEGISARWRAGVLSDSQGRILGATRQQGGIALHTMPRDLLRPRLLDLLRELFRTADVSPSKIAESSICIGLTGVSFAYDGVVDLVEEFEAVPGIDRQKLMCTGDAEIIFAAHAQCETGLALVCHTGSVAYASVSGRPFRYGGWGPAFGDEGSAYSMGRRVLRKIGQAFDEHSIPSGEEKGTGRGIEILWREVDQWLCSPDPEIESWTVASMEWRRIRRRIIAACREDQLPSALFAFAHHVIRERGAPVWWSLVGSLVIPLMRAWLRELDEISPDLRVADVIVRNAIDELVNQVDRIDKLTQARARHGPLVLAGGVVNHNERFRNELIAQLLSHGHGGAQVLTRTSTTVMRPVLGALMFAIAGSQSGCLNLPSETILGNIRETAAKWGDLAND